MVEHFKMFRILKDKFKDLWEKIDQSSFIDEDF